MERCVVSARFDFGVLAAMSHRHHRWLLPALAACLAGCEPAATPPERAAVHSHAHDHADHRHPDSLAAGVAELESLVADIAGKMAAGATDAADDAVHGLGHLLEDLQGLLPKSALTAEARDAATKAIDDLYECFDELDTSLHAAPGKADPPAEVHARLKDRIAAAVEALKEAGR